MLETVWASLVAKNVESACNAGDWVRSLGWEDPLEEGMVTHSSILAWRIPSSPWDLKELEQHYGERAVPFIPLLRDEALKTFRAWEEKQDKVEY